MSPCFEHGYAYAMLPMLRLNFLSAFWWVWSFILFCISLDAFCLFHLLNILITHGLKMVMLYYFLGGYSTVHVFLLILFGFQFIALTNSNYRLLWSKFICCLIPQVCTLNFSSICSGPMNMTIMMWVYVADCLLLLSPQTLFSLQCIKMCTQS